MTRMITRVYSHYASADQAVRNLKAAGLSESALSIVASNAEGWHKPGGGDVDPLHDKNRDGRDDRNDGAVAGGGIGMVAGGAAGLAIGMGLLAVPGVGAVIAAGWYAPVLVGALAGGTMGGLIGVLAESGVSRENAELYAEALRRGAALVTARVPDEEVAKYTIIMDSAAVDVERRAGAYRAEGWKGYDPALPGFTRDQAQRERQTYDLAKTG